MIELALVGVGTGDPDHLTRAAWKALAAADLVLVPRKGAAKAGLADLRRGILAEVGAADRAVEFDMPQRDAETAAYLDGVEAWHDAIAATWAGLIAAHAPNGGRVALLVWGDPSLYDSSLRIAARLRAAGLDLNMRVVPGITSLQMLAAAHGIPLNELGAPFLVTTGRRLRDEGWPGGVDTLVAMLDGGCAFATLPPQGLTIWWGAYLGMPQQLLRAGPLGLAGPDIVAARAAARAEHGWIMDIYLLRRTPRG